MMKSLTSLKTSIFNWESSYFGGHERVIYDHPFIYVPNEIEFRFKNTTGSSNYIAEKLCAMFLHRVIRYHLQRTLVDFATTHVVEGWMGKETVIQMNSRKIADCLSMIISMDTELGNLFQHYYNFLKSIDILYYPPKNEKGDKGGAGESEESEDDVQLDEKSQKELMDALGKVRGQKPFNGHGSVNAVSGDLKDRTEFVVVQKGPEPCRYHSQIIKNGNSLVNLLDISFEPKEDRVENLKCGKMSPHKIAEIPAGNTHIYFRVEEDQATRPFSICVLADESGSMRHSGLVSKQNDLMKTLYYAFSQILPQDKMFFFGHSGYEDPEIRIYHDKYNPNFEYSIDRQPNNDYQENYDGPVVECIYERVREQTSDNIIFISISDGCPAGCDYGGESAQKELKRVIEKCKRDGFVTVGIGLQYGRIKEIYNYHTIVYNMKELVKSVSSLINRVVKTEFKD